MSLLEQTSADLSSSRVVLHHFNDSFQGIQSHLCSIIALSEQWSKFHNSFVSIQASLANHVKELEAKEREINSLRNKLSNRQEEVELVRISLDNYRKEVELRQKVLETRENDVTERFEALRLEQKRVKEWRKAVEEAAKRVEEREKEVEGKGRGEGFEERERVIEEREKAVEERCRVVERREKEVEARSEAVEEGENGVNKRCLEVERREKAVEEQCRAVESREEGIDRRFRELELKEEEIDERCRLVELEEKRIEERCQRVEVREREIEERCEAQELRDRQFSERCEVLESKEKGLIEGLEAMEVKEKGIDERCRAVESKEREVGELCKMVESKGRVIEERSKAQELRERQLSERCEALELKEKGLIEGLEEMEVKMKRIDERCKAVETREREVDELYKLVESKERDIEERCKAQESRDRQLSERLEELELKEKGLIEGLEELEVKEKWVDERYRAVELREAEIDELCKAVELREGEIDELCKAFASKERESEERCHAQELKDKQLSEQSKRLELKERRIDERLRELESKGIQVESKLKQTDEACEALKLKEKHLIEHTKEINMKGKQMRKKCGGLKMKKKSINVSNKGGMNMKKKSVNESNKGGLNKKKSINESDKGVMKMKKSINESDKGGMEKNSEPHNQKLTLQQCVEKMDGEALQMVLNDRVDEHGSMDKEVSNALKLCRNPHKLVLAALNGFFPPHLKKGNVEYEASVVRSSCVLLLRQLINIRSEPGKKFTKKAKVLAYRWKERMMEVGEDQIVALSFLLLVIEFRLRPFFEGELQRLYETLNKDGIALWLHQELNSLPACEGSSMATGLTEVKTEQLQSNVLQVTDADASSAMNRCSKVHSLCYSMDANGLRSYIGQHLMEQSSTLENIRDALHCAPNPAKLLLDVVQIFNQPESTAVEKASCIYLLELLMKLQKQQPSLNLLGQTEQLVKPRLKIPLKLRHKAHEYACNWRRTLADKGHEILDVYGLLQFVATYQLESSFSDNELLRLFKFCYSEKSIYRPEQHPGLCHALGLAKRIPGLINSLVKENRRLHAVKYICTFMMESTYPLFPLLNDHLKFIEKKAKLPKRGNCRATKISVIHNLQDLLQCIYDYGLESKFSPVPIESRIEELKRQIAEPKTATTEVEQAASIERNEGLKSNMSMNLEMNVQDGSNQLEKNEENKSLHQASPVDTRTELSGGNKRISSPCNSLELPQVKRLRAGDPESPTSPNVPSSSAVTTDSGFSRLSPQQWRQPGPCTLGHQSHVRPNGPVLAPETLPAVSGSSVQDGYPLSSSGITPYGGTGQVEPTAEICPGGVNVELKTAAREVKHVVATETTIVEKDDVEKYSSRLANELGEKLSPTPSVSELGESKQSSSPCTSLVLPQQEKHLRTETPQSTFPSNNPIARPVTTGSVHVNPPQQSQQPWRQPANPPQQSPQLWRQPVNPHQCLQPWREPVNPHQQIPQPWWQPGPYPFEHQDYVRPNGPPPMWHPGPWSNAHFGAPADNYGTPYGSSGQFHPGGSFPGGNLPRPGYFGGGQVPYRPW